VNADRMLRLYAGALVLEAAILMGLWLVERTFP
jgi:hypothetical protein